MKEKNLVSIRPEEVLNFQKINTMQLNVCIFGVSGYTGAQLLYFLENHKHVNLVAAFGSESVGKKDKKDLHLNSNKYSNLIISNYENFNFSAADLIFSCLPHGDFQSKIIHNLDESIPLIDLSGDFRLDDLNQYQKFYDKRHDAKEKNKKFIYGLRKFIKKIKNSKFIANPGCYPTSILIPLIPLVRDKLVSNEHIIIDSKSGVSGAGKRLETKYLFAELNENFFSYGIEKHKHIAEIDQELSKFGQNSFSFIPSLLPVTRGLQSTIFIDKKSDVFNIKVV